VTWRGLMVQKAVQQLLFDVDWRGADSNGPGLDVLVIDMPPGTGDVPLSLGQLVNVDGTGILLRLHISFICGFYRCGDRLDATGGRSRRRSQRHCRLPKTFHSCILSVPP